MFRNGSIHIEWNIEGESVLNRDRFAQTLMKLKRNSRDREEFFLAGENFVESVSRQRERFHFVITRSNAIKR